MTVLDFVGNEIKVGSEIVYGHLLGRSAGLSRGKVLEIREGNSNPYAKQKVTLKVERHNSNGSLLMESKWGDDGTGNYTRLPAVPARHSTLQFADRVVVIG